MTVVKTGSDITGKTLPPYASGKLPLLGHVLDFMSDPVPLLERAHKECGNIFSLKLGPKDAVFLIGPDYNKFFFEQTYKLLTQYGSMPFFESMFDKNFLGQAPFETYIKQRDVLLPKFKAKQVGDYVDVIVKEGNIFLDKLQDSGEFDLLSLIGPLVMNVAANAFLGHDFRGSLVDEFFEEFRHFSEGMDNVLPQWFPAPHLIRSKLAKRKLHKHLAGIIAKRQACPVEPPDFLQELVDYRYKDGEKLSSRLIAVFVLFLVWGGHETTAGHFSWALIELLNNPDVLAKVVAEQKSLLGDRTEVTLDDFRRMVYLDAVVRETERRHPVAFILQRLATQDFELDGYFIKQGTMVLVSPQISHHMETVFTDAQAFRPERFLDQRELCPVSGTHTLLGFGGGLQRCSGVNFAYLEMKILLTQMLRHLNLDAAKAGVPPMIKKPATKWPESPYVVKYKKKAGIPPLVGIEKFLKASGKCPFSQEQVEDTLFDTEDMLKQMDS